VLGDKNTHFKTRHILCYFQASVPAIYASRKFKSVSAGKYHTCGILDDYTVQCWGASGEGSEFNVGQVNDTP